MSDESPHIKKFQKELNAGTTSLILLSILSKAGEPMYGYQIAKVIAVNHEEAPTFKQGVLYPVLRSLEKKTLVESQVEPSVSGPPRRYYQITKTGKKVLKQWTSIWKQLSTFVNNILEGE
jgi:PadR family transcriptional regulator PadR